VHKLNNIQQDLQCSDISIEAIPEVNILHLWGEKTCFLNQTPQTNTNKFHSFPELPLMKVKYEAFKG